MTLDLTTAARQLLASERDGGVSMADRVAGVCERLTIHLARLVGSTGVHTLFQRSLVLSSGMYPWLIDATGRQRGLKDDPFEALRLRLAPQDPEAAIAAFVLVMSTFVGLLGRLIGEDLVQRLLHEVWPTVFPDAAEETL